MDSLKSIDIWAYEKEAGSKGYNKIAGLDEAGRGPLAGPVVAAAVMLSVDFDPDGIKDSKVMTAAAREKMFHRIMADAIAVGVGIIGPDVIDEINILRATHVAMRTALSNLGADFDFILVDGLPVPDLPASSLAIVSGDAKCISISSASIIAKVTRDRIMVEMDKAFPEYGFAAHKGYGTKEHIKALDRCGPCPIHRRSFSPVTERLLNCRLPGLE